MAAGSPMTNGVRSFGPSSRDSAYRTLSRMLAGRWRPTDRYFLDPPALMRDALHPPDPWQARVLTSAAPRILILCSRQSGKSLTAGALALLTAILEPGSLTLIVARALRQAAELIRKVKLLYALLNRRATRPPPWTPKPVLQLEAEERRGLTPAEALVQDSVLSMELANESRIIALPAAADTIVGYSAVNLILIDEAARVPDPLYAALRPMLAVSGGRLVALSSARAKAGWFWNSWTNEGDQWQLRVRVTAHECPRISPVFLREEEAALGPRLFAQEYLCEFTDAVDALFTEAQIRRAMDNDIQPLFLGA
jgi:hypothetical protein